jgi:hypothetical protein
MIITTGATLVFCEGLPNSYDRLLLTNLPWSNVDVIPAGGKYGISSFVEGALHGRSDTPYVIFRDRDLDVEPPPQPQIVRLHSTKPIYAGYRSCIESYFLSGSMMVFYWTEALEKRGPCPLTAVQFDTLIESAARNIADYQAVRWGLKKLKRIHPADDLPDKLGEASGELPGDLSFSSCYTDALSIIGGYRGRAGARTPELFTTYANEYRQRFGDPQFFLTKGYLSWFHGKDLTTAFNAELARQRPDVNFPTTHYMGWTAPRFQQWYDQFPDLMELVDLIPAA